jgi:hypothetical protein
MVIEHEDANDAARHVYQVGFRRGWERKTASYIPDVPDLRPTSAPLTLSNKRNVSVSLSNEENGLSNKHRG